jgi:hypothetical protein
MVYTKESDSSNKWDMVGNIINYINQLDNVMIGGSSPFVMRLKGRLTSITSLLLSSSVELIDDDTLRRLESFLQKMLNSFKQDDSNLTTVREAMFYRQLTDFYRILTINNEYRTENKSVNSQKFYTDIIKENKQQLDTLNEELATLKQSQNANEQDIKEKENTIQQLNSLLTEYKRQEQELKQRDDAIETWKNKITESFKTLDNHINPIKDEHKRICNLYWGYLGLSVGLIALLVVIEVIICCKLYQYDGIPKFSDYLWLIIPLPVAVGLLWGFITQLNRAQRQRVVLSRFIHDIKYTEGVLLAVNNLAIDFPASMIRINNALDKLLDKHLSYDLWEGKEDYLKKEEDKDTIPYDVFLQIIKSLRG